MAYKYQISIVLDCIMLEYLILKITVLFAGLSFHLKNLFWRGIGTKLIAVSKMAQNIVLLFSDLYLYTVALPALTIITNSKYQL